LHLSFLPSVALLFYCFTFSSNLGVLEEIQHRISVLRRHRLCGDYSLGTLYISMIMKYPELTLNN
jgi:hypothetical protein